MAVRIRIEDSCLSTAEHTNTRNAAARCCLRYCLSSSKLSNLGYDLIRSFLPETVFPRAPTLALPEDSLLSVVAAGAIAVRRLRPLLVRKVVVYDFGSYLVS